ncbi:metallophosphoesterase [Ornithinibacillus sp. JPR2-1]|uniref:metallophosphoesterase family protein n=1 Tax=Ornithinibacillus sp. JPR2-1 TaxID=2094019 RepID=UPI0031D82513
MFTIKLLYFGDVHIRGTNPRNRKDSYPEALKAKLREIFALAKYKSVTALICAGDIFDRPEVTNGVLLEFAEVFKESPVPIYTTAGNHDIYSYNLDTYNRTSLRILELIVPQLNVINDPNENIFLIDDKDSQNAVSLSFMPYNHEIDKDGYGYSPGNPYKGFKIHTAHGMLLDHDPKVFDRYTYVGSVKTKADLVLCGHDHVGFGRYDRADGKTFLNCGAICRLSASESEIERTVEVALIKVENNTLKDIELIPLQSAKAGDEVLDRSKIEAEQKRAYAMEEFSTLIKGSGGEQALVDVNAIVEAIAEKEGYKPEVVKIALDKIAEARDELKV